MVTTADSSSNHHSPTNAGDTNSPKFPRKNLPSAWAQVVRGGDTELHSGIHQSLPSSSLSTSLADQPPFSDSSPKAASASPPLDNSNIAAGDSSDANDSNAGRLKRPAWNKPSNGVVEAPVMGAVSWPALSESTKTPTKSSANSSSKTATDGSLSTSQGPSASPSPQKQATSNVKPNSATNYTVHHRQRSMKRGSSNSIGSGHAQSSFSSPSPSPPPPPPFPVFQIPPNSYGNVVPVVPDPSPREIPYRNNNWDTRPSVGGFVPAMNDHWNSARRGNFGTHQRGDGSYHNNHGGRRDHDRGNYANTRDSHVQQRIPPRGLVRHPPPNTPPFVPPQHIGPIVNHVGFPEFYYFPTVPLEPFRGMPFITHGPPPAMFIPAAGPPLTNKIVDQIDYYFSDANLVKDEFLRSNMDEQGWVPITLIASFRRVKNLTNNIQLILDSLRTSNVVEVQGDKLRRRNEWTKWLNSSQLRANSGSVSTGGSSYSNIAADFQKITLEEAAGTDKGISDTTSEAFPGRNPTDSTGQHQLPNGDTTRNTN
ncbi:la-related protein 1C-like [Senna tora]|uniref:La-related protein 1C-like n=1 Tax=Senna tora TaxID=362788 RepID=A0A834TVX8_9FABA|nr:la-related protein 1C-like [Senna tora]